MKILLIYEYIVINKIYVAQCKMFKCYLGISGDIQIESTNFIRTGVSSHVIPCEVPILKSILAIVVATLNCAKSERHCKYDIMESME